MCNNVHQSVPSGNEAAAKPTVNVIQTVREKINTLTKGGPYADAEG